MAVAAVAQKIGCGAPTHTKLRLLRASLCVWLIHTQQFLVQSENGTLLRPPFAKKGPHGCAAWVPERSSSKRAIPVLSLTCFDIMADAPSTSPMPAPRTMDTSNLRKKPPTKNMDDPRSPSTQCCVRRCAFPGSHAEVWQASCECPTSNFELAGERGGPFFRKRPVPKLSFPA